MFFNAHVAIIYSMGGKLTWMKHYPWQWHSTDAEEPTPHPRNYLHKIHFNTEPPDDWDIQVATSVHIFRLKL
jgi:hypothetical protein